MTVTPEKQTLAPLVRQKQDATPPSDEVLVSRCAWGDEGALAELYDRYGRAAYGLALRILRDPSLAEDAVQEGFLSAWRTATAFVAGRAKPSTWILTLVHRRAVDLVRREERRRADPLEDTPEVSGAEAYDEAWRRSRREVVRDALRRLPHDQREALELAYFGGYTQSELSAYLGVPLGTIKSRTSSGLRRLQDLLRQAGYEPASL